MTNHLMQRGKNDIIGIREWPSLSVCLMISAFHYEIVEAGFS